MTFDQIAWLPLCATLTAVGLVLTFLAFRRRGAAAGLRGLAWSLLPMAAYLTGALQTLWTIGTTVVRFVTGLVLSPAVWAGIVLAGLSVLCFLISGVLRRRSGARERTAGRRAPAQAAGSGERPALGSQAKAPAGKADDDFAEIEEILKRHGIS